MTRLERHCSLSLEDGFAAIREGGSRPEIQGVSCKVGGLRLRTFQHKGVKCVACGVEGQYFVIERHVYKDKSDQKIIYPRSYHLNMYAVNSYGHEVLMTHDHILARGLGGRESLENTQCMCVRCNSVKGVVESNINLLLNRNSVVPDELWIELEKLGGPRFSPKADNNSARVVER